MKPALIPLPIDPRLVRRQEKTRAATKKASLIRGSQTHKITLDTQGIILGILQKGPASLREIKWKTNIANYVLSHCLKELRKQGEIKLVKNMKWEMIEKRENILEYVAKTNT